MSLLPVHFTPGDGKGWAIDEDLRQIRLALHGRIREVPVAEASVVYCPFWAGLSFYPSDLLRRRVVICHADNPPFFYLKQGGFAAVQSLVDLWVARSREAYEQFQALRLPAVHVPYTTDPGLFHPLQLDEAGRAALRRKYQIPEEAYVAANFHRDTEGGELNQPKVQKNPELLVETALALKNRNCAIHFLLAGPRRHWIRQAFKASGIAFTFVGEEVEEDDFGLNILSRSQLNELYAASDLYLVSSRWEGGPQSIMEAAAARCAVLSTRVGLAMDILNPHCLFETAAEAAEKIQGDMQQWSLRGFVREQEARFQENHTTHSLLEQLPGVLETLAERLKHKVNRQTWRDLWLVAEHELKRRLPASSVRPKFTVIDEPAASDDLQNYVARVKEALQENDSLAGDGPTLKLVAGSQSADGARLRLAVAGCPPPTDNSEVPVGVPSVADAVALKQAGWTSPMICLPFLNQGEEEKSGQPLIMEQGVEQSDLVWKALTSRRPVVYARTGAYREQIFNAGISYGNEQEKVEAAKRASLESDSLCRMIWTPSAQHSLSELHEAVK